MRRGLSKYFWSLSDRALAETGRVLREPEHPLFAGKAVELLSRCDEPRELFRFIPRTVFVRRWPAIKRMWRKSGADRDYLAWWDAIHQEIVSESGSTAPQGGCKGRSACLRNVGRQIRLARQARKMTQVELARRVGTQQKEISRVETGRGNPTIETLLKLARVLNIKRLNLDVTSS